MLVSIPGFIGYSISDSGVVISHSGRWKRLKDEPLRQNKDKKGYFRVALRLDRKTYHRSVHRLVMLAFVGDSSLTVNHKDLNKSNNNLSNLEYMSSKDNTRHAVSNGHMSLSNAVLDEKNVIEIRSSYVKRSNSSKLLSEKFGVTQRTIVRIANGELWKHVA